MSSMLGRSNSYHSKMICGSWFQLSRTESITSRLSSLGMQKIFMGSDNVVVLNFAIAVVGRSIGVFFARILPLCTSTSRARNFT